MPRVYRAAISTYVVFGIILGVPAVALSFRWRDAGARHIVALIAVAAVFWVAWIAAYRIVITEDAVHFRSLFASAKAPRRAVRSADVVYVPSSSAGPLRLVVKYDGGGEIDINAKVFSREAIQAVLALAPKPRAHQDS